MTNLTRIQRGMYQAKTATHHYFAGQLSGSWEVTAYPTNDEGIAQTALGFTVGQTSTLARAATMIRDHAV